MPSNWLSVDNNFPSFTGKENPTEQIRKIHNYLFCLKGELKFMLQNLTADNWNSAEWDKMAKDANNAVLSQVTAMGNQVSELKNLTSQTQARVSDLSSKVTVLGGSEAEIRDWLAALDQTAVELAEELELLKQAVDAVISFDEEGNPVIGKEGGKLYLMGEIYMNGVLLGGESDASGA